MPTFNDTLPDPGDSPSVAPGQITDNFKVVKDLMEIDHRWDDTPTIPGVSGKHDQVTMPNASTTPPAGRVANEGTLYVKDANSQSEIFWTSEDDDDEYQMTVSKTAAFTEFATNTNYQAGPPSLTGGWTFLPGGMLLQYGITNSISKTSGSTITFPVAFSAAPYSIVTTQMSTSKGSDANANVGNVVAASFSATNTSDSSRKYYWQAIGPA